MPIAEFIIELFCRVDDRLGPAARGRGGPKLVRSELVTIGLLFAIKGGSGRAFSRWLSNNYRSFFPNLPHRTRLFRRLFRCWEQAIAFLADPTLLGVVDTYGIELIHPCREGRSEKQIGRKGLSNHRWIVGAKLGYVLNQWGEVVAWTVLPANVHANAFACLIEAFADESVIFADTGLHRAGGDPPNARICKKGEWNDRMLVETVLGMMTTVMHTKKMLHRTWEGVIARLSYVMAAFNLLITWDGLPTRDDGFIPLHIASFSL
jgi:hypothetical protein